MKVHHIECGTFLGFSPDHVLAVNHCLLIETHGGLVLVDSGLGIGDAADPRRIGWMACTREMPTITTTKWRPSQAVPFNSRFSSGWRT